MFKFKTPIGPVNSWVMFEEYSNVVANHHLRELPQLTIVAFFLAGRPRGFGCDKMQRCGFAQHNASSNIPKTLLEKILEHLVVLGHLPHATQTAQIAWGCLQKT